MAGKARLEDGGWWVRLGRQPGGRRGKGVCAERRAIVVPGAQTMPVRVRPLRRGRSCKRKRREHSAAERRGHEPRARRASRSRRSRRRRRASLPPPLRPHLSLPPPQSPGSRLCAPACCVPSRLFLQLSRGRAGAARCRRHRQPQPAPAPHPQAAISAVRQSAASSGRRQQRAQTCPLGLRRAGRCRCGAVREGSSASATKHAHHARLHAAAAAASETPSRRRGAGGAARLGAAQVPEELFLATPCRRS
jgi:hypothetical protein